MKDFFNTYSNDRVVINYKGKRVCELLVLEPKSPLVQTMENLKYAKFVCQELEAGTFPNLKIQSMFNSIKNQN